MVPFPKNLNRHGLFDNSNATNANDGTAMVHLRFQRNGPIHLNSFVRSVHNLPHASMMIITHNLTESHIPSRSGRRDEPLEHPLIVNQIDQLSRYV